MGNPTPLSCTQAGGGRTQPGWSPPPPTRAHPPPLPPAIFRRARALLSASPSTPLGPAAPRTAPPLPAAPLGPGHLAQRAAARRRLLDDLRGLVVADVRIERGGHGQRALGRRLAAGQVRLDAVDALLAQHRRARREQVDGLEQVLRD